MKKGMMLLVVLCFLMGMAGNASAALMVDQEQASVGGGWTSMGYTQPLGQEFVPDVSNLAAAELYITVNGGGEGPGVTLNVREDTIDGTIVGTGSIESAVTGWNLIDLDSYAWLTVGETYVLEFISSSPNGYSAYRYNYDDGASIVKGKVNTYGYDLPFRTYYDDTAAVPIPGAVWLLGSGLLGLIGIRRKGFQAE